MSSVECIKEDDMHILKITVVHIMRLAIILKMENRDFPGGPVVKNLSYNAGDTGSIPGLGRSHVLWSS